MNVDSFFTIGSTHQVCEDYARSGWINEQPYAIISDGCSNGGVRIDTDFGSRLLVAASENHLSLLPKEEISSFQQRVISEAEVQVRSLNNVPKECLAATLGIIYQDGDYIKSLLIGDGFVGGKRKDGTWGVTEYSFNSGAPYYLKYTLDFQEEAYFEKFGSIAEMKYKYGELGSLEEVSSEIDLKNDIDDENPRVFQDLFWIDQFEFVFIASDGLSTFHTKHPTSNVNMPVELDKVLSVLFNFKGYQHNFLQRQMNWVLKTTRQRSISREIDPTCHHFDDLSIGVIHCG